MNTIDVSIVIVNYNTVEMIIDCIRSIKTHVSGIIYEIIVVDNASKDNCIEILSSTFGDDVQCIALGKNIGFGLANNEAFKIARGRHVFLLNPDTVLLNNAVKILSDYLDMHSNVGICGGNLYDVNMQPTLSYRMLLPSIIWEVNELFHGLIEKILWGKNAIFNYTNRVRFVGYITGADLMISKSLLEEIGGFSNKFFLYFEETELTLRVRKKGFKVCSIPTSLIQHLEGQSMANDHLWGLKREFIEQGKFAYYSLHYSKWYMMFAYFIYIIFILSRVIYFFVLRNETRYKRYIMRMKIVLKILYANGEKNISRSRVS